MLNNVQIFSVILYILDYFLWSPSHSTSLLCIFYLSTDLHYSIAASSSVRSSSSGFPFLLPRFSLMVFAFKGCDNDTVYHGNGNVDSEGQDTTHQLGTEIDRLSEDDFVKVHDEKTPDWIQGTWVVETDYGDITVKIRGKHISETSADKTIHGTYYYENQQLNCDYGDGSFFIYKVDVDGKRIDAGDGMYMHKVN